MERGGEGDGSKLVRGLRCGEVFICCTKLVHRLRCGNVFIFWSKLVHRLRCAADKNTAIKAGQISSSVCTDCAAGKYSSSRVIEPGKGAYDMSIVRAQGNISDCMRPGSAEAEAKRFRKPIGRWKMEHGNNGRKFYLYITPSCDLRVSRAASCYVQYHVLCVSPGISSV